MKTLVTFLLFTSLAFTTHAQDIPKLTIDQLVKMIDTSKTPLLVNFWATWCGPCVREIPWFEKQVATYGDKVRLVLVSIDFADDYPAGIADFVKKQGYKSEVLWLNETNADVFCPRIDKSWEGAIPATLMVNNKTGFRRFHGQQITEPRLQLEIAELTKE